MTRDERIAEAKRENPELTYKALAERFGVCNQVVYRALYVAGLVKPGRARRKTPQSVADEVVRLRKAGETYMAISVACGISVPVVNRILR